MPTWWLLAEISADLRGSGSALETCSRRCAIQMAAFTLLYFTFTLHTECSWVLGIHCESSRRPSQARLAWTQSRCWGGFHVRRTSSQSDRWLHESRRHPGMHRASVVTVLHDVRVLTSTSRHSLDGRRHAGTRCLKTSVPCTSHFVDHR